MLETGLATYPDVTIVCGPRTLDHEAHNAVTNPTLIVEVLSRSTEEYDLGNKFEHYKRIPSLQQCVLIGFREQQLEVWSRRADGWEKTIVRLREVAALGSIGAELNVTERFEAADQPRE